MRGKIIDAIGSPKKMEKMVSKNAVKYQHRTN